MHRSAVQEELLLRNVWSLVLLLLVVLGGRGDFLTSASSVLPVPALSATATPAPAAAPAVAPPAGAAPATLVALPLPVQVADAFPVPIEVAALALVSPPVIAVPVWTKS